MAQQIGQIAKAVTVAQQIPSPQSAATWHPVALQAPKTDEECAKLQQWAETAPHGEPAASVDEIARHLEYLSATLPSRRTDTESARMKFAVYIRILSGQSNDALAHMSQRVVETYDWFPTPHQCLEAINSYIPRTSSRDIALHLIHQYHTERFEDWLKSIPDLSLEELNAAPERWKRIADCQLLIRRIDDGSYIKRAPRHAAA